MKRAASSPQADKLVPCFSRPESRATADPVQPRGRREFIPLPPGTQLKDLLETRAAAAARLTELKRQFAEVSGIPFDELPSYEDMAPEDILDDVWPIPTQLLDAIDGAVAAASGRSPAPGPM